MHTYSLSEAKASLSALVESLERTHEPVTITRHGKAAAVLISPDDLATLMETLAWLSDPGHEAEMAEADAAIEQGRTLSLDEVREQLAGR